MLGGAGRAYRPVLAHECPFVCLDEDSVHATAGVPFAADKPATTSAIGTSFVSAGGAVGVFSALSAPS